MRIRIENQQMDEERALYNLQHGDVVKCTFAGEKDGESVLKEVRDVNILDSNFSLRYPLWHAKKFNMERCSLDEKTRASIWYADDAVIKDCNIDGIKCLRECRNIKIEGCNIHSPEFGWNCKNVDIKDSSVEAEYFLMNNEAVRIDGLKMKGKYSFQYIKDMVIYNSNLDTKDAFWHSENVTVVDSVVKGEYLAWYSEGLTLINCKIIGTQPLCYCKNLKLINCTMEDTDLSFEYSEVDADIKGNVVSIKNPKSGTIVADSVGEIIKEDAVMDIEGQVIIR